MDDLRRTDPYPVWKWKDYWGILSPLAADCSITMMGYMPSIRTEKEKGFGVNGDKMNTTKKLTISIIK